VIHISKSEVLPVHLALINSTCLHDMLCGSLGIIKFDIELVVLYFFQNLFLLIILECLARYLGLLVNDILACDLLRMSYLHGFY